MQRFSRRAAAVLALAALAACDSPIEAPEPQPEDLAAMVEALGFRGDMVQDFGDYVLVEGDIHITKAALRAGVPRSADPLGPRFQYRTSNLVSAANVNDIIVDVSGLSSEPGWQTAAREALTHWSGVPDSNVRMVEGTPADITVATTCTSSNVAAFASFPAGGNAGPTVFVNTCFGFATSHAQRVHNMVHEFGHTLGFRHSNYTQMGESAGTDGAVHVPNTPTSGNAAGSAMNGGTALNAWAGFASSDLWATRSLYPLPYPVPWVTSGPQVAWGALVGATEYTVQLIRWKELRNQNNEVTSLASTAFPVGTTTSSSITDSGRAYTGLTACYATPTTSYYFQYEVRAVFPTGTTVGYVPAPVANCALEGEEEV